MLKERFVTVKEAAEYLRVSHRTAQRYIEKGLFPYTKPAGKILINEQHLSDFANNRKRF